MRAPKRPDEAARLAAVERHRLPEPDYGSVLRELVAYAAEVCDAPVSLVSMVEEDRQRFLAEVGFGRSETTLDESICAHTILESGILEVPDAFADPRFADNPLVTGDPRVRFYAGISVRTDEGLPLGAFCVLDTKPRVLTEFQRRTLALLGKQAEAQIKLQQRTRELGLERNEAEAARGATEDAAKLLRLVIDRMPVRVCYVDAEFRYRFVNQAFETHFRTVQHAIVGRTVEEVLGGEVWRATESPIRRALAGETHVQELEVPYAEGVRHVSVVYAADPDEEGTVRGVVCYTTDVTDQRRLERDLANEKSRLAQLLDRAPAFTALLEGPDLRFTYVNEDYRKLVGHRDVLGLPVREALPELMGQGYFEALERVLTTGESFGGDELHVRLQRVPEGPTEERYVNLLYQAMFDADGKAFGVFAHGVDVTPQVLARRALAEREELFRTVYDQAPDDAILILDLDRRLLAWNPAAERICGWTSEEALGGPIDLIFTPEDRASGVPDREVAAAARDGKVADERWHVRKDGRRFWSSGTMNSLHRGDGTVRGFLKVFRDASERHEMERRIREMNEALESKVAERTAQLEKAVREAEGFNYSISHDLRAPLRAMASTSSILLEELGADLGEEHRALLTRQAENANRLGRLIDELLRLSRLARAEVRRQTLDLTEMARSVFEELRRHERTNGCAFDIDGGMVAEGDAGLVRTVLQNLIGNALKFSPSGGVVRMGQDGDVFSLSDEGVGFDVKFAPKIFLPFERLVTEDAFPGTGIGLANVKRIVERHGGRVWVESAPGEGSTFFFTLR